MARMMHILCKSLNQIQTSEIRILLREDPCLYQAWAELTTWGLINGSLHIPIREFAILLCTVEVSVVPSLQQFAMHILEMIEVR